MQGVSRPILLGSIAVAGLTVALVSPSGSRSSARPRPGAAEPVVVHTRSVAVPERSRSRRSDLGFDRYRRLLERNPFSPRVPRPAGSPPVLPPGIFVERTIPVLPPGTAPEAKKPATPPATPSPPPAPPDPLKDWTYTGTVAIGGEVYAVLENKSSKGGEYLKVGDVFQGATVDHIAQGEISVTLNGQARTLSKSSAFNATPLNASGPAAGPPAGQPPPGGAPGSAPGAPGAPNPPGAPPRPGGGAPAAPAPTPAGAPPVTRVVPR